VVGESRSLDKIFFDFFVSFGGLGRIFEGDSRGVVIEGVLGQIGCGG